MRPITASTFATVMTPGFRAMSFSRSMGDSCVQTSPRLRPSASSTALRSLTRLTAMDDPLRPPDYLLGKHESLAAFLLGHRRLPPRVPRYDGILCEAFCIPEVIR